MRKLLSLGLILVLCVSVAGCSKKMSEEKIVEFETVEQKIEDTMSAVENIGELAYMEYMMLYQDENKEGDYQHENDRVKLLDYLDTYESGIENISTDELEKYHTYLVDYKEANKNEEQYNFLVKKYELLRSNRLIAYSREILNSYEGGIIDISCLSRVIKLNELMTNVYVDDFSTPAHLVSIQSEIDEKYGLDVKELYDVQQEIQELQE